jgi:hypothetical protein
MANPRKPLPGRVDPEAGPPAPDLSDDREFVPEEWDPELTVNPTGDEGDDGAVPTEENPFADTPVTVPSTGLGILPQEGEPPLTIELDDGEGEGPAPAGADELFAADPPPDPPVASLSEPLPEMAPEIWQAGVRALLNVPDTVTPAWPEGAYWSDLGRLYLDELGVADTAARQVEMTLAAAEVADLAADPATALALCDDALTLAPDAPEALRLRGRLAERDGDVENAYAAWARLADAAPTDDERAFYVALCAEWSLARRGQLDIQELDAIPDGPARHLAVAEEALLHGTPPEVAAALEQAAFAAGGAVGGALLDAAARFHEVAGDPATAAERRFVAAQMDPASGSLPLGRLRDAARAEPGAAEGALGEILPALAGPALGEAVARWAASLARRRGDRDRARALLAASPGSSAALRDQIDLLVEAGAPVPEELLARSRAASGGAAVPAARALGTAAALARAGDREAALGQIAAALQETPDAVPLGVLAEEVAREASGDVRVAGLELALRADPARKAHTARALAAALEARGGPGSEAAVRAALETAVEAALGGATFWWAAAREARAGQTAGAAAKLAQGAERWAASRLARPLGERAAELEAREDAVAARARLDALVAADPNPALRWTLARVAARVGDEAGQAAALGAGAALEADPHARAGAALRRALAAPAGGAGEWQAGLEAALGAAPDHPIGLVLLLGDAGTPPERATQSLWNAGGRGEARRFRLEAVLHAALTGQRARALALAQELHDGDPLWPPARRLLVQMSDLAEEREVGERVRATLTPAPDDEAEALLIGEALEARGDGERAAAVLRPLAGMRTQRFAADARRALARLGALAPDEALSLGRLARPADHETDEAKAALARLDGAARAGRWGEAVTVLRATPPHLAGAAVPALYLAGLVAEGRGEEERAPLLFVAAFGTAAIGETGAPPPLACALRAAEAEAGAGARAWAIEQAAARAGVQAAGEPALARAAATFLCHAAAVRAADGDKDAAARCLLGALLADPGHLPAVLGVRRAAARRGDVPATINACEHEAEVLVVPEARVWALLLGAALAGKGPEGRPRAIALLRRALEVDPANETAFERLRALLAEAGDDGGLAAALLGRIAVARNPFELTTLRIARAELLAGPLGDRAAAKAELATILQKEPQHPRALARLGDLEYEDGNYAEAGELYVRRAVVERSTAELREVFLRLGRIYTRHVPDEKRAASAYERVVQIEPDNYEALAALSDLYHAAGEVKSALTVTERLANLETDPARRLAALVRAGQLWERTGDLRQAGARLRKAADEAPRDAVAVTELARFLERTRDLAGRRALLDHAVGLLRHDVERGRFDLGTLRTLVPLLQARGRSHAAAAAAQLVGVLSSDAADRQAATNWAAPPPRGRRLAGLAAPEIDERSFPPGLPPGVRHVFRLMGPLLVRGAADLARAGVDRSNRVGRGQSPRDVVDAVAVELGVRDVDVYVKSPRKEGDPSPLLVEPGAPPAVIVGARIVGLGPHALRFAAARALRLVATHLDLVLAEQPGEAGALLGGVVRQFVAEYRHPEIREEVLEIETQRVAKVLSRKVRQEVMPFAIESAGAFDLGALHDAVRDGANAVGLLASGDLPSALAVVLATGGAGPGAAGPEAIAAHPEALALLRFALSDDYDAMAQAME